VSTNDQPPESPPAKEKMDHHLEAYKLLANMLKQEESVFWTRNQALLALHSALAVILVGILALKDHQGQPAPATIQQTVDQPAATGSWVRSKWVPLSTVCSVGFALGLLWLFLIKRAEGINEYFIIHMKYLEENYLQDITIIRTYDKLFTELTVRARRRRPKFLRDTFLVEELTVKDANGKDAKPQLPRLGSFVTMFQACFGVALLFLLLWVFLGAWILLQ
jgi:hypothetical protein